MEVDDEEPAAKVGSPAPSADDGAGVIKSERKTADENTEAEMAHQNTEPISEEPAATETPQILSQQVGGVASSPKEESTSLMDIDPTVGSQTKPAASEADAPSPDDADEGGSAMSVEAKSDASLEMTAEAPPLTVGSQSKPDSSEASVPPPDDAAEDGNDMSVEATPDVSTEIFAETPPPTAESQAKPDTSETGTLVPNDVTESGNEVSVEANSDVSTEITEGASPAEAKSDFSSDPSEETKMPADTPESQAKPDTSETSTSPPDDATESGNAVSVEANSDASPEMPAETPPPTVESKAKPDTDETGTSPPDDADDGESAMLVESNSDASPEMPAETPPPSVESQTKPDTGETGTSPPDDADDGESAMLVESKSDASRDPMAEAKSDVSSDPSAEEAPPAEAKSVAFGLGLIEVKSNASPEIATGSGDGVLPEHGTAEAGSEHAPAKSGDEYRTEQDLSPLSEALQPMTQPDEAETTTDRGSLPSAEAEPRAVGSQPPEITSPRAVADNYVASNSRIVATPEATRDVGFGSSEVLTQASAWTMDQLAIQGDEEMEQSVAAPTVRRKGNARLLLSMLAVLLFGILVGVLIGGPGTGTTTNVSSASEGHAWSSSDSPANRPSLRPVSPPKENVEMSQLSHRGESTQASSTLFSNYVESKCKHDESSWRLDLITYECKLCDCGGGHLCDLINVRVPAS